MRKEIWCGGEKLIAWFHSYCMHCTHTKKSMHSFLYRIRKPNRNVYILSNYSSHKRLKIALRMQFTCAPLVVCNHLVVFVRLVAFHLDGWWWRFRVVCAHAAFCTHTKFTCEPNWKIIYDRNRLPFETVNYYLCKCPQFMSAFKGIYHLKFVYCTLSKREICLPFSLVFGLANGPHDGLSLNDLAA